MILNNLYLNLNLDTKVKNEKSKLRAQADVEIKLSEYKSQLQEISGKLDELILAVVEQHDQLDEKIRSFNSKRSKHQDCKRRN